MRDRTPCCVVRYKSNIKRIPASPPHQPHPDRQNAGTSKSSVQIESPPAALLDQPESAVLNGLQSPTTKCRVPARCVHTFQSAVSLFFPLDFAQMRQTQAQISQRNVPARADQHKQQAADTCTDAA